ncbi:SDR family NAD(P)-dependent oxidoreductase, partial [Cupriavidus sp. 2MCAB6]
MRGLAGKAILVTGSTSGIGYAMAERLVAEGAKVLVHG